MTATPSGEGASRKAADRLAWLGAVGLTCATLATAIRRGAFVAGGSDSYCYVGQAGMWLDGSLFRPLDPGLSPGWNNALLSFAPTGFVPSPVLSGAIAPICPPGLGLLMAGGQAIAGLPGAFAIVPLCGALTVWCAFVLGRRLAGAWAGILGACLTLVSPVFLNQLVQPMSDVPAAAFWTASLTVAGTATRRSSLVAGVLASLAILVRPNLAPLAVPVAWLAASTGGADATFRTRVHGLVRFAIGALPGVLAVATLHQLIYGSPLRSGYGDPALLFAWSHVPPNLARYSRWLVDTHTPWTLLGLAAPFVLPRVAPVAASHQTSPPRLAAVCLAFVAIVCALYVPYVVFEDWTYLRFLLPGLVVLFVLAAAVTLRLARLMWRPVRAPFVALVLAGLTSFCLRTARERHVFDLHLSEARFQDAGTWVRDHLPPRAVVLSVWHSGSLRFYGRRLTVLWDAIEPAELDLAVGQLQAAGRAPFLLLESWEVPRFRERFRSVSALGGLDWPPRAQIGREIVLYDLGARDAYFRGERVRSERVWTRADRAAFRMP